MLNIYWCLIVYSLEIQSVMLVFSLSMLALSITRAIGRGGPWSWDFWVLKWQWASECQSGQKKSRFKGPPRGLQQQGRRQLSRHQQQNYGLWLSECLHPCLFYSAFVSSSSCFVLNVLIRASSVLPVIKGGHRHWQVGRMHETDLIPDIRSQVGWST